MTGLRMYTVYRAPLDLPGAAFAVRRWDIAPGAATPTRWVRTGGSLAEVRAQVPADMVCLARSDDDDPSIVETWL